MMFDVLEFDSPKAERIHKNQTNNHKTPFIPMTIADFIKQVKEAISCNEIENEDNEVKLFIDLIALDKTDAQRKQIFNKFRDTNQVRVKGKVNIDGGDYIIERILTRSKKKSEEGYTVKTDLNFQKVMADGSIQNLEGEQRRETDDFIKKSIGDVDDFLLTIIDSWPVKVFCNCFLRSDGFKNIQLFPVSNDFIYLLVSVSRSCESMLFGPCTSTLLILNIEEIKAI
jgi:hypothetical protein